jgi:hypothetical protein
VQAGHKEPRLGSEEPEGGVVSPKEPAQPIAGTNSEPSRDSSLTPGASAGTANSEAPIAIKVGQVWRGWGREVRVVRALEDGWWRIVGVEHGQQSDANSEWFRDATLVEPAPKAHPVRDLPAAPESGPLSAPSTDPVGWCPQCGPVTRVDEDGCCAGCGADAHGEGAEQALDLLGGWAANVPEPPPVNDLLAAANKLEYEAVESDEYAEQFKGREGMNASGAAVAADIYHAVASWLRSVAAAMGAEEGRGDGE